ncbi:MAG: hypothetical protein IAF02_16870, partial [Anaerolineae bacterium]|nr:hypothetical protein [Anaerolineae bacterium]
MTSEVGRQLRGQRFLEEFGYWLYALALAAALTLIFSISLFQRSQVTAVVGVPAPVDIFAPVTYPYTSQVLTDQARKDAANSVPD